MNIVSVIRVSVLIAALIIVPMETRAAQIQKRRIKRLVGVYTLTRAAAVGMETLTLTLNRDKSCTLVIFVKSTSVPASILKPTIEKGSWKMNGMNVAVDLTQNGTSPEMIEIIFELQGDVLVATKYDQSLYGTDGLRLKRRRRFFVDIPRQRYAR